MTEQNEAVIVKLLDREYAIKCPKEKVPSLLEAARYLDAKIRESKDPSKTNNLDRIFMIAALNITNELVNLKQQQGAYIDALNKRIHELQNKIDQTLAQ